jgi:hypothetical protein
MWQEINWKFFPARGRRAAGAGFQEKHAFVRWKKHAFIPQKKHAFYISDCVSGLDV